MLNREQKVILGGVIVAFLVLLIGITYAYFTAQITGQETTSTIIVTGGELRVTYENLSSEILVENIYPRSEAWVAKNFTVTGTNTTDLKMKYKVGIDVLSNTFRSGYLTYSLTNTRSDSGTPIPNKANATVPTDGSVWFGEGLFVTGTNQVHAYTLNIFFKDNNMSQNASQEMAMTARVIVDEAGTGELATGKMCNVTTPSFDILHDGCVQVYEDEWFSGDLSTASSDEQAYVESMCTTGTATSGGDTFTIQDDITDMNLSLEDAEDLGMISNLRFEPIATLTNGLVYTDGQYTYTYDSTGDGWAIMLTDKTATTAVTTEVCYTINDKSIISAEDAFSDSQATTVNLTSFDTSTLTNMTRMFTDSAITTVTTKTQADADRLGALLDNPASITFTVGN